MSGSARGVVVSRSARSTSSRRTSARSSPQPRSSPRCCSASPSSDAERSFGVQSARRADHAAHREHGALLGAERVAAVLPVFGVEVQRLGDIVVERHELLAGPGTPVVLWLRREQTTQLGLGFGVVAQFEQGQ